MHVLHGHRYKEHVGHSDPYLYTVLFVALMSKVHDQDSRATFISYTKSWVGAVISNPPPSPSGLCTKGNGSYCVHFLY